MGAHELQPVLHDSVRAISLLCEAPQIVSTSGAGCISPRRRRDHGRVRSTCVCGNRGRAAQAQTSFQSESFEPCLSKRHIKARGIRPDRELWLWHRGRRARRQSAPAATHRRHGLLYVSAARYIAAGHRRLSRRSTHSRDIAPNAVVKDGLQLMRAHVEKKKAPAPPPADSEFEVANAGDYAGVFSGEKGQLEFAREGTKLFLVRAGKRASRWSHRTRPITSRSAIRPSRAFRWCSGVRVRRVRSWR